MKRVHFLYHELRLAESQYSYVTPLSEFEAHCRFFASVQNEERSTLLRPEVTFDDGNCSDLDLAMPVLARYGLLATFFITAGWTGQREGFLSFADLRTLHGAGHTIGAHGMHHTLLTSCSSADLDEELRGARQRLEDGLGAEVRSMSLPGGRGDSRVLHACQQAGYQQVFTSVPQAADMFSAPFTVGRLNLHNGTKVAWLERVLDPGSGVLTRLERSSQLKATAQRLLGDRLYARLWAMVNRQEPDTAEAEATTL